MTHLLPTRTQALHVRPEDEERVRAAIGAYTRLWQLINELTACELADLRREARERRWARRRLTRGWRNCWAPPFRRPTVAYEGTRGFQPLVAVWAEQQLIAVDEFRDGNVAGGEDPLSSVQRAFANLPSRASARVVERRFCADSAAYYTPLLTHLVREEIAFAISADITKEASSWAAISSARCWW